MKKIALALLFASSTCSAAEWRDVWATDAATDSSGKIDITSIARSDDGYVTAWTKYSYKHPQTSKSVSFTYMASLEFNHYDCRKKAFGYTQAIYYQDADRQGKHLSVEWPFQRYAVVPGTVRELQHTFVCAHLPPETEKKRLSSP